MIKHLSGDEMQQMNPFDTYSFKTILKNLIFLPHIILLTNQLQRDVIARYLIYRGYRKKELYKIYLFNVNSFFNGIFIFVEKEMLVKIKDVCQSKISESQKIIHIANCEHLNIFSYYFFKRIIELFSLRVRFILSFSENLQIPKPLLSRCLLLRECRITASLTKTRMIEQLLKMKMLFPSGIIEKTIMLNSFFENIFSITSQINNIISSIYSKLIHTYDFYALFAKLFIKGIIKKFNFITNILNKTIKNSENTEVENNMMKILLYCDQNFSERLISFKTIYKNDHQICISHTPIQYLLSVLYTKAKVKISSNQ
uniref:Uncharacterized protein n=2 Tax=Amorphochlora amoebiformis TaxID=1561963 RepID=A0A0H5BI93_9EUKA|nr:hypothetical protein [Amorphochlora amoebiformis]